MKITIDLAETMTLQGKKYCEVVIERGANTVTHAHKKREKGKPWTESEMKYLEEAVKDKAPLEFMANKLNRTVKAVAMRIQIMGLKKKFASK